MEVKKRIALELQSKKPAELSELVLDNCRAGEDGRLEGLTEELSGLWSLSLINMGLRTLEHLPRLPSLELLDLSDNRISNGLEFLAERTPKLTHLSLGGNRVKELCVLEVLKNLLQLQRLELMGCEVANLAGIRESVFEILPHLVYLDGADRLGALEPDSEDGDDDGDKCDEDDLDASESEVEDEEEEGEICEKDFLPDNEEEEEEEEEEGELEDADEEDEEEEEEEDEDEEGELEEDEDEENKHLEENKNDEDKHVVSEQSCRGLKRKHDDCEGENDGPSEKVRQVRLRNPNSGDLHD